MAMNYLREFLPNRTDYKSAGTYWRRDLMAGITVGIVALPLALAFGITTGAGATAGLVTAIIAGFIAAVFGGSNFQVSGPTGAMTVVLVPIVAKYGVESLIPLGFFAGLLTLILGIIRAGSLINRVPWPVMEGFTLGIAVVIALQQIPTALATPSIYGGRTVSTAWQTFKGALETGLNFSAIFVVVLTLLIKFTYPIFVRKFKIKFHIPASFLALVVSSIAVSLFAIDVPKVGDLPKAIFHLTNIELFGIGTYELITAVIAIAALASIESLLSARVADQMAHIHEAENKYQPNRELFGQGLASMFSSIFGGMPATGAIARTGVNIRSGATSRLSAIFHAVFLLSVVFVLSPIISRIPTPALAGVLLGTSYRMASPGNLREMLRTTKLDGGILLLTAAIVIFIDLIWGIAIGTLLYFTFKKINLAKLKRK
jgi:SulP family sulfate permease